MNKEELFKEIQDIVSNNPVIILGSGASVSYGIPGMWDLAQKLKTHFEENPYTNEESSNAILAFLNNLNKGLGLEEALLKVKVPDEVERDIVKIVWKVISESDQKVYERFVNGEEINLKSLFDFMIYDNREKVINVVSTNYDKIAEYAACQTDAYVNTGFTIGYKGRLKENIISKPRQTETDYIGHINILKVHGSLDWFKKEDEICCFTNTSRIPVEFSPCIVTPGTNKYEKTQQEPHRQLLSTVDSLFNKASGYLCIGYGFNDMHVHPMLLKYAKKHNNKILILTKDLTPSIRENVIGNGYNYIAITSDGNKGTIFETPTHKLIIDDEIYWTIDGFEKIYK